MTARDPGPRPLPGLPFTARALLAPMEGVTDPAFRDLVLGEHRPADLGGAFTEFVRVTDHPVPARVLLAHLGPRRFEMPVGLQLMGNDPEALAETARRAAECGVPLLDLNFGCPARGAFSGCAGSALLDDPARMERLVAAVAAAVPELPVTAKIRSGVRDDRGLEDTARAVEQGGARLLTIHCRTRVEGYRDEAVDWDRIRRAVEAVSIPVCGNGGVATHRGIAAMRAETGCALVMIGRGAIADPWIFSGSEQSVAAAADFLLRYADAMRAAGGSLRQTAGRVKQLLKLWRPGGLAGADRGSWLRERDPERLLARLRSLRDADQPFDASRSAPA